MIINDDFTPCSSECIESHRAGIGGVRSTGCTCGAQAEHEPKPRWINRETEILHEKLEQIHRLKPADGK